jgi:hypothetical protein
VFSYASAVGILQDHERRIEVVSPQKTWLYREVRSPSDDSIFGLAWNQTQCLHDRLIVEGSDGWGVHVRTRMTHPNQSSLLAKRVYPPTATDAELISNYYQHRSVIMCK